MSLADAQQTIEAWRLDYNVARPHSGLANRTPEEFARAFAEKRPPIVPLRTELGVTSEGSTAFHEIGRAHV